MEKPMRKVFTFLLSICMSLCIIPFQPVLAEDPPYTDTDYWNKLCSNYRDLDEDQISACEAYLKASSSTLNDQLEALKAQEDDIKANIADYGLKIQNYQEEIDAKQTEINATVNSIAAMQKAIDNKQIEIDNKQIEIENKQKEIDATQAEIDAANEKIKTRMEISQSSMRLNKYTDILMGADSFEEFLRISNGLSAIAQYDQKILEDMKELRAKLNQQREEMEAVKAEMEAAKEEMEEQQAAMEYEKMILESQQNEIIVKQTEVEQVRKAAMEEEARIRSQSDQVAGNIAELNSMMVKLAQAGKLDDVTITTNGWTYPVPGAYVSAGTWSYDGAGYYPHLGMDFAAGVGTTVVAIGNGVVLHSVNGCPTYGYLGNWCGSAQGGAAGGGNQVFELTVVNGSLYAVSYYHMMLGSPVAAGTVLSAGDYVGQVGSAGNSTGPHCHVEIMYLGDGSDFSYYAQHWNGDFSFGCGWQGYDRKCDAGYGAPCRIRPETVFGY